MPQRSSPGRRRSRWPLIAAGAALAVAAVGGGLYVGLRGEEPPPVTGDQVGASESSALVTIPRNTIRAKASSTLQPAKRAYRIANTLDENPRTAWNNDGEKDGTGKGVKLTYRFDQPWHLARITLSNGYLESSREKDVWHKNGRLHRIRLTTETTSQDYELADTKTPQTLDADLGTTRSVTITILSTHPGTKFKDVALTEIAFQALP